MQGVYFRQSTRIEAQRLSIVGFARNESDGSVEVLAQGTASAVAQLRQWLDRGPRQARVDAVIELKDETLEGATSANHAPSQDFDVL